MQLIDINRIEVRERQRCSFPPAAQNELKQSILDRGLLQPPGGYFDDQTQTYVLVWGERRLRMIKTVQAENKIIRCNQVDVPIGQAPFLLIDEVSAADAQETELDENIRRLDLEWPDQCRALAKIHELRQLKNPSQSVSQTAREITEAGGNRTSTSNKTRQIIEATRIVQHLDDPSISKARNATEAHGLILKKEEEKLHALLAKRSIARGHIGSDLEVRHADLFISLPAIEGGTFDLILADPPYGNEASSSGYRSRSVHHHNYDDSMESARSIALCILTEGFRITKPRANLFLFCNPRLWNWLSDSAANMGWSPFPRPIIWQKSESEGLAPWGGSGFRLTYDMIFYATKGQKGLIASPIDIINVKRVPRHERIHAAEKPVELLRKLIEISTLPGDSIIDPCCGSGATLVACRESRRRGLGIEKDDNYFNTALANVHGGSHNVRPETTTSTSSERNSDTSPSE